MFFFLQFVSKKKHRYWFCLLLQSIHFNVSLWDLLLGFVNIKTIKKIGSIDERLSLYDLTHKNLNLQTKLPVVCCVTLPGTYLFLSQFDGVFSYCGNKSAFSHISLFDQAFVLVLRLVVMYFISNFVQLHVHFAEF